MVSVPRRLGSGLLGMVIRICQKIIYVRGTSKIQWGSRIGMSAKALVRGSM